MPEGGGILTFFAMLLVAPFQMTRRPEQEQLPNRPLSPHELELRRASRPPAVAAVAALGMFAIFGGRDIGSVVAAFVLNPGPYWPALVLLPVIFAYGLAAVVVGARRCLDMRDAWLAVRAFFKLALGATATVYLWPLGASTQASGVQVWALLVAVGVWCFVTGAVRFLLLVLPIHTARQVVVVDIDAAEFQWDAPARKRWWQFWKG